MEIRDKSGRKISLLNDSAPSLVPALSKATMAGYPPRSELHRAPFSSLSSISTISSNPPTPLLERSDSSDSAYIGRTPSPITPHQLSMERLTLKHSSSYGEPELYSNANPYLHMPVQIPYDPIRSSSELSIQPTSHASSSNTSYRSRRAPVKSSKNTHPCPVATQYQCDRYFTTSGHAARHAKIHSGEKSVRCPECPKTFARKDNMDQHRKTHRRAAMQQQQHIGSKSSSTSSISGVDSSEESARKAIRKQRKRDMRISRSPDMTMGTSEDSNMSAAQTPDSGVFPADAFGRQRSGSNGNSLDMLAEAASTMV